MLEAAIREGRRALADTINQNPVLKKAGVVDAGGKGYLVILQGCWTASEEGPCLRWRRSPPRSRTKADFAHGCRGHHLHLRHRIHRAQDTRSGSEPFRTYLNSIGDSLVIGEDDEAFKVHVHTNIPGAALTESQKYGTLELAKIENMRTRPMTWRRASACRAPTTWSGGGRTGGRAS